jgi:hypothetical protein
MCTVWKVPFRHTCPMQGVKREAHCMEGAMWARLSVTRGGMGMHTAWKVPCGRACPQQGEEWECTLHGRCQAGTPVRCKGWKRKAGRVGGNKGQELATGCDRQIQQTRAHHVREAIHEECN